MIWLTHLVMTLRYSIVMLCDAMLFSSFVKQVLSNTQLGIVDVISWYHGHQLFCNCETSLQ